MKSYLALFFKMFAVLCLYATNSHAQVNTPHIVLVQNSGWMEPFYADPNSPFVQRVEELIQVLGQATQDITVATFSQSSQGLNSPSPLKRGNAKELKGALKNVAVATKNGDPNKLADTDFKEALSAVVGALPGDGASKEGVIWLITNNKNSPGNDQNTVKRNTEYYDFLHKNQGFSRVLAWPLKMEVKGKLYAANGIMIYAIAQGARSGEALQYFADNGLKQFLQDKPARLKPQNAEAVTFKPMLVENSKTITAAQGGDGKTLILNIDANEHVQTAVVKGKFANNFNLYDIQNAHLSASYGTSNLAINPRTLGAIPAEKESDFHSVSIVIPALKNAWSWDIILEPGQTQKGVINIHLEQELKPSLGYEKKFKAIFPNDPLPDLFKPSQISAVSDTTLPLTININYPSWPLLVLMGLLSVLILAVIAGIWWFKQERRFVVTIDDLPRTMLLTPFKKVALRNEEGQIIGHIVRGFGRPDVQLAAKDHIVSVK